MKQYSRADFLRAAAGGTVKPKPEPNQYANQSVPHFSRSSTGLSPYTGGWGQTQIMHLLRRSLFGVSKPDYDHFAGMTLTQCLDELLTPSTAPDPPVNNYNNANYTDPNVALGQPWVTAPFDTTANGKRIQSLKAWWAGVLLAQDRSLTEKMTLFLHNHFATQMNVANEARTLYKHHSMVRSYALGNFKDLTHAVTTDPTMLIYLNGNTNTKTVPNENYGRELQELFTVGKGPDSLYTEDDVKAAARVLTGWKDDITNLTSVFNPNKHDSTSKQFSAFYGNTVINGLTGTSGALETDQLIDMIFTSPASQLEAAKFLCRNLYRWFVYYVIDTQVESDVITPLADVVINNNFELAPVLRALLSSEHFYDPLNIGCHIKNPMDHSIGFLRQFEVAMPDASDIANQYDAWILVEYLMGTMAMDLGDPPNVAGWPAYYQEPQYHELWINSDTLPLRNEITDYVSSQGGFTYRGVTLKTDFVAFAAQFTNVADPNLLIADSAALLSPNDLGVTQTAFLKSILLSGQTADHYWSDAWNQYAGDPTNQSLKNIVETRLRSMYSYMMDLAEYQLI